ncbi:store-operated calcium entry-associated regulatory factor [Porphyrio hochstetteri]
MAPPVPRAARRKWRSRTPLPGGTGGSAARPGHVTPGLAPPRHSAPPPIGPAGRGGGASRGFFFAPPLPARTANERRRAARRGRRHRGGVMAAAAPPLVLLLLAAAAGPVRGRDRDRPGPDITPHPRGLDITAHPPGPDSSPYPSEAPISPPTPGAPISPPPPPPPPPEAPISPPRPRYHPLLPEALISLPTPRGRDITPRGPANIPPPRGPAAARGQGRAPGRALSPAPSPDRVLLRDVQALTLRRGGYTAARRAAPGPQLQCTGGSAGCARVPEVVQCYNRGWDGFDVQWQCRAELDSALSFGQMEVSCEGYDYPDDPYILRGSCSLHFRLELTEEGERKVKNSGSFGSGYYQPQEDASASGSGVIVVVVLLALAVGVYKLFLSQQQPQQRSGDADGFQRPSWWSQQAPPPPGFKSSFTEGSSFGTHPDHGASSGPGFWTGLGAGGLLGYLAGSHRAQPHSPCHGAWTDPTAAAPGSRDSNNSTQGSGTRTASGFGGTKRR